MVYWVDELICDAKPTGRDDKADGFELTPVEALIAVLANGWLLARFGESRSI
jgi:hypothetical protein